MRWVLPEERCSEKAERGSPSLNDFFFFFVFSEGSHVRGEAARVRPEVVAREGDETAVGRVGEGLRARGKTWRGGSGIHGFPEGRRVAPERVGEGCAQAHGIRRTIPRVSTAGAGRMWRDRGEATGPGGRLVGPSSAFRSPFRAHSRGTGMVARSTHQVYGGRGPRGAPGALARRLAQPVTGRCPPPVVEGSRRGLRGVSGTGRGTGVRRQRGALGPCARKGYAPPAAGSAGRGRDAPGGRSRRGSGALRPGCRASPAGRRAGSGCRRRSPPCRGSWSRRTARSSGPGPRRSRRSPRATCA